MFLTESYRSLILDFRTHWEARPIRDVIQSVRSLAKFKAGYSTAWCNSQTNGSDGEYSRGPRLRRVRWGLILASARGRATFGTILGIIEGRQQTVLRAELNGLLELAKRTDGDIVCVVECEYVVKGYRRGPKTIRNSDADMWSQLWRLLRNDLEALELGKSTHMPLLKKSIMGMLMPATSS